MRRLYPYLLSLLFLAIIAGVPLAQGVIDVKEEEEDKPVLLTLFDSPPSEKHLRELEQTLERNSYFEQKIRPLFQLARYSALGDLGEKALAGRPGWYYYSPGVRYLTEPYHDASGSAPAAADPVAVISDLARQLGSKKIELLVVPVPGKASVYPDGLVSTVEPDARIARNSVELIRRLRGRKVQVMDLHRAFLQRRRTRPDGPPLYMRTDTHWTGEGARLAAEVIAARVKARPWFDPGKGKTRYTRRAVTLTRRGDVPRMTRIPNQERLFPAEAVTCYRVFHRQGGEPYEQRTVPRGAQVLVLGDSFSRIYQTDPPGSAGWIANLAHELQAPVDSIVNDGGASTLVRQELARDLTRLVGKRLVIWIFVERDVRFGLQGWQPVELWPSK